MKKFNLVGLFTAVVLASSSFAFAKGPCTNPGNNCGNGGKVEVVQGPKGDKGDTGKPGKNGAPGKDGTNGVDGLNGSDGRDGVDGSNGVNGKDGRNASLSAVAGLGAQHLMDPYEGGWSYGVGVTGVFTDFDESYAVSGSLGYGISDDRMIYGKISVEPDTGDIAAHLGYSARF